MPRSCTQPSKSAAVILFGVFSAGWSGARNVIAAVSSVTRSLERRRL
jgi:hypothetical protein